MTIIYYRAWIKIPIVDEPMASRPARTYSPAQQNLILSAQLFQRTTER
jgi:hypothetical protein